MDILQLFMAGEVDMQDFVNVYRTNMELKRSINELIPEEAKKDKKHELWNRYSFDTFSSFHFSITSFMESWFKFDGSMGDNLNVFNTIRHFYHSKYPDAICTNYYDSIFKFSLDITQDCYEGQEVSGVIEKIAKSLFAVKPKSEGRRRAKEEIKRLFHVEGNKRPNWIQGAEWPMGKYSPMKYIDRKRIGERVDYYFIDVDTNEERIVQQWY